MGRAVVLVSVVCSLVGVQAMSHHLLDFTSCDLCCHRGPVLGVILCCHSL